MSPSKSRAIPCRILRFRDFLAAIPALLLAPGCGGSALVAGGASPDGSTLPDTGAAAPLDCSTAAEGAPCDHEGAICRDTCPACATCGFLGCGGGHWSAGSDFPPQSCFVDASGPYDAGAHDADVHDADAGTTIPCGPSPDGGLRLCTFPLEYCEASGGGPPPPPDSGPLVSYACVKVPAACASSPTCACLKASATVCGGSGSGAVVFCTTPDGGVAPTVECGFP